VAAWGQSQAHRLADLMQMIVHRERQASIVSCCKPQLGVHALQVLPRFPRVLLLSTMKNLLRVNAAPGPRRVGKRLRSRLHEECSPPQA
jgi:hypothetical protein